MKKVEDSSAKPYVQKKSIYTCSAILFDCGALSVKLEKHRAKFSHGICNHHMTVMKLSFIEKTINFTQNLNLLPPKSINFVLNTSHKIELLKPHPCPQNSRAEHTRSLWYIGNHLLCFYGRGNFIQYTFSHGVHNLPHTI